MHIQMLTAHIINKAMRGWAGWAGIVTVCNGRERIVWYRGYYFQLKTQKVENIIISNSNTYTRYPELSDLKTLLYFNPSKQHFQHVLCLSVSIDFLLKQLKEVSVWPTVPTDVNKKKI